MPYTFEYAYTDRDFIDLNRVYTRANNKFVWHLSKIVKVVGFCVGLFALLTAVLLLALGGGFDFTVGIMLVLGGYLVTQPFFKWGDKLSGRLSRQVTLRSDSTVRIVFEEDAIRDTVAEIETIYPYASLQKLLRHGDRYYLFVDKNKALILPKRGIVDGNFEGFALWIEEKTGKPVEVLKRV